MSEELTECHLENQGQDQTVACLGMPGIHGSGRHQSVRYSGLTPSPCLPHRPACFTTCCGRYRKTIIRDIWGDAAPAGDLEERAARQPLDLWPGSYRHSPPQGTHASHLEKGSCEALPGKGSEPAQHLGPLSAFLWSWHCPVLAWEQGWLVLPPSWTPRSLCPFLPNPEKAVCGAAEEASEARGLFRAQEGCTSHSTGAVSAWGGQCGRTPVYGWHISICSQAPPRRHWRPLSQSRLCHL